MNDPYSLFGLGITPIDWAKEISRKQYTLPEGEELHSQAMRRYWNDAMFNTRCQILFQVLDTSPIMHASKQTLIYALFLDDLVRNRSLTEVCDPPNGLHSDPHKDCILR